MNHNDGTKFANENPACYLAHPPGVGTMMRVAGEVKFVEDSELRPRLLEERPFLKAFVSGPDDQVLQIFRIYTGVAHFWTMENNMRESEIERIAF